jgi:hypothetical protein
MRPTYSGAQGIFGGRMSSTFTLLQLSIVNEEI